MKYPSADSLNSATDNSYSYENIIQSERHLLSVISWELLQYPVFDFLNFFLAQGCFFQSDRFISKSFNFGQRQNVGIAPEQAVNMRKYAEFFTDFCI